ncbi:unnamed protein product [Phaedon cochleariae]|uniref:Regulatory protein zeste n=1 Tax=Phaedon cochleariae TaxID=80249 RepID=A0A9P0DE13_PHACE|nr:unnamed protein product [Phaedon cochleariae]
MVWCPICDDPGEDSFHDVYSLRRHVRKFHPDKLDEIVPKKNRSSEAALLCHECGESFSSISNLNRHVKNIHYGKTQHDLMQPKQTYSNNKIIHETEEENFKSENFRLSNEDYHVIREDAVEQEDGSVLVVPREAPKLTEDAVPTIFIEHLRYRKRKRLVDSEEGEDKVEIDDRKISEKQKTVLFSFLEKEVHLRDGTYSEDFTLKDARKRWMEISDALNNIPGPKRGWNSWRQTWKDMRRHATIQYSVKNDFSYVTSNNKKILKLIGYDVDCEEPSSDKEEIIVFEHTNDDFQTQTVANEQNNDVSMTLPDNEESSLCKGEEIIMFEHTNEDNESITEEEVAPKKNKSAKSILKMSTNSNMSNMSEGKFLVKERYYAEKLEIMKKDSEMRREHLDLIKRDVEAKERIAKVLEGIIANNTVMFEC